MEKSSVKSVGKKWFLVLMIFLWGCIVLCGYIVYSIININKFNELSNQIDDIRIEGQKSTVAAKEFLMNAYTDEKFAKFGSNESYELFNANMDTVQILTQKFKKSLHLLRKENQLSVAMLDSNLISYKQSFFEIANLFKKKGFKDLGLEGEMRSAIHFIENQQVPIDLEYLLRLRRHEKDFLLRKDVAYVEKFNSDFLKFKEHILTNKLISNEKNKSEILKALEAYKSIFEEIVDVETTIGLSPKEGLRFKFTSTLEIVEKILSDINTDIKQQKRRASYAINVIVASIIVVFVLIISGVIYSVNYLNFAIIKPIHQLNKAAEEISEGNLSVNLDDLKQNKLMHELVLSFGKLMEKLKSTISHIELISSRKITTLLELHSEKDEIGKSLNRIVKELQSIDAEEKTRAWSAEGISKFGEIIRESPDLNSLTSNCICFLVKYLSANQGGLFIVKTIDDKKILNLESSYAYNRKKHLQKQINVGEGLLGQCYLEKEITLLTDVPDAYLSITSGMGDANPRSILIAPMISNDKVEAVIELASFKVFETYQIEFIEKIGEILASSIANAKNKQLTEYLLLESENQSLKLKQREEEMHRKLEEIKTEQTEHLTKEEEYRKTIDTLKLENLTFHRQLAENKVHMADLEERLKKKEEVKGNDRLDWENNTSKMVFINRYPRRIEHFLES